MALQVVAVFGESNPGVCAGAQAQQLCRATAEALCGVLSAAWRSGDQAGVKAAFLPITDISGFSAIASTGTEQQVPPGKQLDVHVPMYAALASKMRF